METLSTFVSGITLFINNHDWTTFTENTTCQKSENEMRHVFQNKEYLAN